MELSIELMLGPNLQYRTLWVGVLFAILNEIDRVSLSAPLNTALPKVR